MELIQVNLKRYNFMKVKKGKVRTTDAENVQLQQLFLAEGFTFLSGRNVPHIHSGMDFFYFNNQSNGAKIISWGSKASKGNNQNPFNLVFYSGEDWFKMKRFKEYSFSEIIEKFGKKDEPF